jgi:hypothetical protein
MTVAERQSGRQTRRTHLALVPQQRRRREALAQRSEVRWRVVLLLRLLQHEQRGLQPLQQRYLAVQL